MDTFLRQRANMWTTIAGILAALALWANQVGAKLPTNKQEWTGALASLAVALVGVFAKDATTGSRPK